MPIFREFWAWVIFIALASFSTASAIISADKSGDFWGDLTAIGQRVEPLWIGSAILAYTFTEGATVLADTLKKKQYNAGMAKGRTEGEAVGIAKGRTEEHESWIRMLNAHPDKTAAEIRRMVERGELPTDA